MSIAPGGRSVLVGANAPSGPDRPPRTPRPVIHRFFTLDVRCGDELVYLTPKERDILRLLLANPGKLLSRERILSTVWRVTEDPLTNVVTVYIGRLRKKLGACGEPIETIRSLGYRYNAGVDSAAEPAEASD